MKATKKTTEQQQENTPFMERIKLSAQTCCPEQFRAAYAHLVGALWQEAATLEKECELSPTEQQEVAFRRAILLLIIRTPKLDYLDVELLFEAVTPLMPKLETFQENLRMLFELRQGNVY